MKRDPGVVVGGKVVVDGGSGRIEKVRVWGRGNAGMVKWGSGIISTTESGLISPSYERVQSLG